LIGQTISLSVKNAYSTGIVQGDSKTGGLIGEYTSGVLTGLYWDAQSSEISIGVGDGAGFDPSEVSARSTAQMQRQSTFAGWEFDGVWKMNEGQTYPYLDFQTLPPVIVPTTNLSNAQIFQIQNNSFYWLFWSETLEERKEKLKSVEIDLSAME